jgi:hypothetical protein
MLERPPAVGRCPVSSSTHCPEQPRSGPGSARPPHWARASPTSACKNCVRRGGAKSADQRGGSGRLRSDAALCRAAIAGNSRATAGQRLTAVAPKACPSGRCGRFCSGRLGEQHSAGWGHRALTNEVGAPARGRALPCVERHPLPTRGHGGRCLAAGRASALRAPRGGWRRAGVPPARRRRPAGRRRGAGRGRGRRAPRPGGRGSAPRARRAARRPRGRG